MLPRYNNNTMSNFYLKEKPNLVVDSTGAVVASGDACYGPWDSTTEFEEWLADLSDNVTISDGLTIGITQSDGHIKDYKYENDEWVSLEDSIPENVSDLNNDMAFIGSAELNTAVQNAMASLDPSENPDEAIRMLAAREIAMEERFNSAMHLLSTILQHIAYEDSDGTYEGIEAAEEFVNEFDTDVKLVSITATFFASNLYVGDTITNNMFGVTAHYSDGTSSTVTGFTISPSVLTSTSTQVTVSYSGKTTPVTVIANANAPEAITAASTRQTGAYVGESVDTSKISVSIRYSNGNVATFEDASSLINVSPSTLEQEGTNAITISLIEDDSITATVSIDASEVQSLYDVEMLGHYGQEITLTQGSTSHSTDYYYSNASATYNPCNGKDVQFYSGSITASNTDKTYGEKLIGYTYNGEDVNASFSLASSGIFAPKVKGNLAHFKFTGIPEDTWGEYESSSVRRRTNPIQVNSGQTLTFRFPESVSASQTVYVMLKFWNNGYSVYKDSNNNTETVVGITLDENREGTLDISSLDVITTNNVLNAFMIVVFAQEDTSSALTSFTAAEIQYTEINYTDTVANGVPAFHIEKVGSSGTAGLTNGSYTWPRSAAYYDGKFLSISGQLYKMIVVDTETGSITSKTGCMTYSSAISTLICKSASFMSIKAVDTDFYPILVVSWGTSLNKVSFVRLAGTSATSLNASILATWTFTGASRVDVQMSGNDMYAILLRDSDVENAPVSGTYRIPGITLSDIQGGDTSVNVTTLGYARIAAATPAGCFDHAIVSDSGADILVTQKFKSSDSMEFAEWEYRRLGTTQLSSKIIGLMSWTKRITNFQLCGIAYAGNGVFYMTGVENYGSGTRPVNIYKITTTLPDDGTV